MSTPVIDRRAGQLADGERAPETGRTSAADLPPEVLRPLLEGARARGMADALELVGVGAVLLDRAGAVLHVGACAAARMEGAVAVASRHLVGTDPAVNRALQDVVAGALAGRPTAVELENGRLAVRALPIPGAWDNPYQLMKAMIVFDAPKSVDEWVVDD